MICLWCHGYGSIDTIPYIGEYSDAKVSAEYDSLIYSKFYLIFTVILLIISLIYLFLYILRKSEKENLTFSLLCLFTGIYLCIFYFGEYSLTFLISNLRSFSREYLPLLQDTLLFVLHEISFIIMNLYVVKSLDAV